MTKGTPQASVSAGRALLRVQDVSLRFGGIVALDGVSFDVAQGQICGLIGPNGAGKSTLFNCLSRLYRHDRGVIEFEAQVIDHLPRHAMARIGMGRTFQNLALFSTMTVRENVLIGTHVRHHNGFLKNALRWPGAQRTEQAAQQRCDEMLQLLDLQAVGDRVVADLPFGTQKRVELARALASSPKLLLLDEPACGLNHAEVQGLGDLITRIRDQLALTVLLVEHHMGLVMGISDHIVALNFGKKIAEGSPAAVRQHPAVIEAYLGADSEEVAHG